MVDHHPARKFDACGDVRRQLEEVKLAERIGIDQIWFFEHHLQPTAPVPSPNLLIAAASRTTRHIRFSSMVNILPFRHPLLVAEEAAMLDNLTGGRLDMGLGRGLRPPEFAAFGVDQQQSREMFLEAFDIIQRVWADENFVHHGKYWTVRKEAPLSPPLVQHPHPPFLVSAQSEESLRWAAEHDIPFAQIDSLAEQARRDQALYREVQTAHGYAPRPRPRPMSRRPPVRLSSIAASSATSSGWRNGRMLTMLAKRICRVLCAAAAISRLGDGTGAVGCR